jgi:paired amphipathic helix protein Sin3a
MNLYKKDREKPQSSSRQEAVYRLSAESLMQDESMMRLEFVSPLIRSYIMEVYLFKFHEKVASERLLTMQLLGKEDHISDDSFTAEEKWAFYVDQFVQLSTNEKLLDKNREPFLKRNLPSSVSRDPPQNVETKSGLELKICMNTYKIFFVDGTEDYFHRRRETKHMKSEAVTHSEAREKKLRHEKFRKWLDGETGWKSELGDTSSEIAQANFDDQFLQAKSGKVTQMKGLGEMYRKFQVKKA